jgi:hypothetical protein
VQQFFIRKAIMQLLAHCLNNHAQAGMLSAAARLGGWPCKGRLAQLTIFARVRFLRKLALEMTPLVAPVLATC